jgi:imidazole glycerol phosphate synthase glutamine amidotransferase subunit
MVNADVIIVRTGTANLASVVAAFGRAGRQVRITSDPADVAESEKVVLPGVGSFGPVASRIDDLGMRAPLKDRISQGRPTLAICLGLQILATNSEEDPGVPGLGILSTTATRFPDSVRVPQLGWNRVEAVPGCRLLDDGCAYFANSYRLEEIPEGWNGAMSDHGGSFVAAVERGAVLACQFHPELSGQWGQSLIERWLESDPC